MTDAHETGAIGLPGQLVDVRVQVQEPNRTKTTYTLYSFTPDFSSVRHLLSEHPTTRPNRTTPVQETPRPEAAVPCYDLMRRSGALRFWDDPAEDVYGPNSGEPI